MKEHEVAPGITIREPKTDDLYPGWRVTLDLSRLKQKSQVFGPTRPAGNKTHLYWWLTHTVDLHSAAHYVAGFYENIDGSAVTLTL
jgi:hypothetical protein